FRRVLFRSIFNPSVIKIIAPPGNTVIHQALVMTFFPSYKIFPKLGSGAGTPAPKKLSMASFIIDMAKINVAWTISGEIVLGAICPQIIRVERAPIDLNASTYVCSLIVKADDLTTLAIKGA